MQHLKNSEHYSPEGESSTHSTPETDNIRQVVWSYDVPHMLRIDQGTTLGMYPKVSTTNRFVICTQTTHRLPNKVGSGVLSRLNQTFVKSNYYFPSIHLQRHILGELTTNHSFKPSDGTDVQIVYDTPQTRTHPTIPWLKGYVSAVAMVLPTNTTRLIRINAKSRYKYNDAIENKISSDQLIELYICMECFDAPQIDLVKYRNGNFITMMTVSRNRRWFDHFNKSAHFLNLCKD